MHWFRILTPLPVLGVLLLWAALWAGGWLLCAHTFRLRLREQPLAGLGVGLLLFIALADLLALILPVTVAFWSAAGLMLLMGGFAAWRSPLRPVLPLAALRLWPQFLAFFILFGLFAVLNRGLALFDDYHNLPLVSMMAAGDIPPHNYLDPSQSLAYHYGLHVFAAMLVRIGGFFPWGAFDLAKALSLALTLGLAWLLFRRQTRSVRGALLGSLLVLFAGGSRWILLFFSQGWLERAGKGLQFLGTAAATAPDLYTALLSPWKIEGGGPFPFPFAFANGLFSPLSLALGGSGALPQMTLILLLLLTRRRWQPFAILVFSLLFASLALSGEHLFVLLWGGLFLVLPLAHRTSRSRTGLGAWSAFLLGSAALSLLMGGIITGLGASLTARLLGLPAASSSGFTGFALRWPPAAISAHLGVLSLTQPAQVIIALLEAGPALLLAPWATRWAWRRFRRGDWLTAGVGVSAWLGLLLPLFVQYLDHDRDITRLAATALFIWVLLGFPFIWQALLNGRSWLHWTTGLGCAALMLGGLVSFGPEMIAVAQPQFSYFISEPDALLSQKYWNQLEAGAQVMDFLPFRAISLFGRTSGRAHSDIYTPYPEWEALVAAADPVQMAQAGYSYLYLDKTTWQDLTIEQKNALQKDCVARFAEQTTQERDFRWLLDISACR